MFTNNIKKLNSILMSSDNRKCVTHCSIKSTLDDLACVGRVHLVRRPTNPAIVVLSQSHNRSASQHQLKRINRWQFDCREHLHTTFIQTQLQSQLNFLHTFNQRTLC